MVLRGLFSSCLLKGKKSAERHRQFKQKFIRKADTPRRDWSGIPNGTPPKKNTPSGVCIEGFKDVYEMVTYWWGKVAPFLSHTMMGQISFEGYFFQGTSRKSNKVESPNYNVSDIVITLWALEDTHLWLVCMSSNREGALQHWFLMYWEQPHLRLKGSQPQSDVLTLLWGQLQFSILRRVQLLAYPASMAMYVQCVCPSSYHGVCTRPLGRRRSLGH